MAKKLAMTHSVSGAKTTISESALEEFEENGWELDEEVEDVAEDVGLGEVEEAEEEAEASEPGDPAAYGLIEGRIPELDEDEAEASEPGDPAAYGLVADDEDEDDESDEPPAPPEEPNVFGNSTDAPTETDGFASGDTSPGGLDQ